MENFYCNDKFITNVIKIQSIVRKKLWFLPYINLCIKLIKKLYVKYNKNFVYEKTLFGNDTKTNIKYLKIAFELKQRQMKEGLVSQIIIGNWYGWEDLGIGDPTGLDCRKKDNSIIMEIKNKYNTLNYDSQKSVFNKLTSYKKYNKNTRCILAIVNPKIGSKLLHQKIIYENITIEKIQGDELFKLIFTIGGIDYSNKIINTIKNKLKSIG